MPVSTRTPRERGELQRKAAKVQREKMHALTTVNGTSARPLDSQKAQEKPSTSAPSAAAPRKRYQAYKKKLSVRVWWPPTRDRKKSDFSGMYWPAVIIRRGDDGFLVQYDNGEQEWVDLETVSPNEAPVKFGGELRAFHVGEFVEVSNDSETDPAAWLGKVKSVNQDSYTIEYPFHDCSPEEIKPELLRRARVYDPHMDMWLHIHPYQVFKAGQVVSPLELELVEESKLFLMIEKFERELYDLYKESVQKRAAKTSRSPAKRKPRESDAADEKPNGRNKK